MSLTNYEGTSASIPEIISMRAAEEKPAVRTKGIYPKKESLILSTLETAQIKLREKGWKSVMVTEEIVAQKRNEFKSTLDSKIANQAEKSPNSVERERVMKTTNKGTEGVKKLLQHDYDKEAPAYYARFGIHRVGKGYKMRTSIATRLTDIQTMLAHIGELNTQGNMYNAEFWQKNYDDMLAVSENIVNRTGGTSMDVAGMNQLKKETNILFNYIICLIKANTPKEYWSAAIREFGFMKEFYN
jgi:hypothetical protein